MEDESVLHHQVAKRIKQLASIKEMPELLGECRKFLTHFVNILQRASDSTIEDYYFQTLYLCGLAVSKTDLDNRDKGVVIGILNTILQTINRDYVRKKVVIEALGTLYQIMQQLFHLDVKDARQMLRTDLQHLSPFFCNMDHFGLMYSIVGILYEYLMKYEGVEKQQVFDEIMADFKDPTKRLAEMLQWPPATFYVQCRNYLNGISGRKYYSLAAISAIFGDKTIVPTNDMCYISFEWNLDPSEISFKALFKEQKDTLLQASIDLNDVRSLEIIEDLELPRVICTYSKITIEGTATETYYLHINAVDNDELSKLAEFVSPLVNSVKFVKKSVSPVPESLSEEMVLVHEKFYDTTDFVSHALLEQSIEPKSTTAFPEHGSQIMSPAEPQRDSQIMSATEPQHETAQTMPMVNEVNVDDKENRNEATNVTASSTANFQPFDMNWKTNLLQHVPKNQKINTSATYDPYDIELMREDEIDNRKEKFQKGRTKNVNKLPKYMQCSTPSKSFRRTTLSKSRINEDLSSISGDSGKEWSDDEKNDATYMPYSMLSGATKRGRGNKKESKRDSSARAKRSKKSNTQTPALGSGKATGPYSKKTQICDISSSTPHVKTTIGQAVVPTNNIPTCASIVPYSNPSKGQTHGGNKKMGEKQRPLTATCGIRKRLNSKHTTTTHTTTTKTTTTKTTEVGLATCAVNGPGEDTIMQEDTTMQEDTISKPPAEVVTCRAAEQLRCRALYTVQKHQEYRVHHMVDEVESFAHVLSEEDRRQALVYARKIVDILTHGM